MTDRATSQSDNIMPPRLFRAASGSPTAANPSGVWVQSVDGTARPYNIALLPFGGKAAPAPNQADHIYLTLLAETADVFFYFSNATSSVLDDTVTNAAGAALTATTMANTMCARCPFGVPINVRIERNIDSWIVLKCAGSGTATLRVWASSQAEV